MCSWPFGPVAFGPMAKPEKYTAEDTAHLMLSGKERKKDARPTLRVHPNNLTSSHQASPLKGSATSQYGHRLVIKSLTYGYLGNNYPNHSGSQATTTPWVNDEYLNLIVLRSTESGYLVCICMHTFRTKVYIFKKCLILFLYFVYPPGPLEIRSGHNRVKVQTTLPESIHSGQKTLCL